MPMDLSISMVSLSTYSSSSHCILFRLLHRDLHASCSLLHRDHARQRSERPGNACCKILLKV